MTPSGAVANAGCEHAAPSASRLRAACALAFAGRFREGRTPGIQRHRSATDRRASRARAAGRASPPARGGRSRGVGAGARSGGSARIRGRRSSRPVALRTAGAIRESRPPRDRSRDLAELVPGRPAHDRDPDPSEGPEHGGGSMRKWRPDRQPRPNPVGLRHRRSCTPRSALDRGGSQRGPRHAPACGTGGAPASKGVQDAWPRVRFPSTFRGPPWMRGGRGQPSGRAGKPGHRDGPGTARPPGRSGGGNDFGDQACRSCRGSLRGRAPDRAKIDHDKRSRSPPSSLPAIRRNLDVEDRLRAEEARWARTSPTAWWPARRAGRRAVRSGAAGPSPCSQSRDAPGPCLMWPSRMAAVPRDRIPSRRHAAIRLGREDARVGPIPRRNARTSHRHPPRCASSSRQSKRRTMSPVRAGSARTAGGRGPARARLSERNMQSVDQDAAHRPRRPRARTSLAGRPSSRTRIRPCSGQGTGRRAVAPFRHGLRRAAS